jgi:hypothetical protein
VVQLISASVLAKSAALDEERLFRQPSRLEGVLLGPEAPVSSDLSILDREDAPIRLVDRDATFPAHGVEVTQRKYPPLTDVANLLALVGELLPTLVDLAEPVPSAIRAAIDRPFYGASHNRGMQFDLLMKKLEDGIEIPPGECVV